MSRRFKVNENLKTELYRWLADLDNDYFCCKKPLHTCTISPPTKKPNPHE
jgi:hypothetical protein